MILDEQRTLKNYILSLENAIKEKQRIKKQVPDSNLIKKEIETLQIVRDDLQLILAGQYRFITYWDSKLDKNL